MRRSLPCMAVALATFGLGAGLGVTWAIYREPAEVPAPAAQATQPAWPSSRRPVARLRFSERTYSWETRVDEPPGWVPVVITGPNNPCELKGDPEHIVPERIVRLCAGWDGRGNVFEWLRERGARDEG